MPSTSPSLWASESTPTTLPPPTSAAPAEQAVPSVLNEQTVRTVPLCELPPPVPMNGKRRIIPPAPRRQLYLVPPVSGPSSRAPQDESNTNNEPHPTSTKGSGEREPAPFRGRPPFPAPLLGSVHCTDVSGRYSETRIWEPVELQVESFTYCTARVMLCLWYVVVIAAVIVGVVPESQWEMVNICGPSHPTSLRNLGQWSSSCVTTTLSSGSTTGSPDARYDVKWEGNGLGYLHNSLYRSKYIVLSVSRPEEQAADRESHEYMLNVSFPTTGDKVHTVYPIRLDCYRKHDRCTKVWIPISVANYQEQWSPSCALLDVPEAVAVGATTSAIGVVYEKKGYTIATIVWRYAFLLLSFLHTLRFIACKKFTSTLYEQKWLIVLQLMLMLYLNPLFALICTRSTVSPALLFLESCVPIYFIAVTIGYMFSVMTASLTWTPQDEYNAPRDNVCTWLRGMLLHSANLYDPPRWTKLLAFTYVALIVAIDFTIICVYGLQWSTEVNRQMNWPALFWVELVFILLGALVCLVLLIYLRLFLGRKPYLESRPQQLACRVFLMVFTTAIVYYAFSIVFSICYYNRALFGAPLTSLFMHLPSVMCASILVNIMTAVYMTLNRDENVPVCANDQRWKRMVWPGTWHRWIARHGGSQYIFFTEDEEMSFYRLQLEFRRRRQLVKMRQAMTLGGTVSCADCSTGFMKDRVPQQCSQSLFAGCKSMAKGLPVTADSKVEVGYFPHGEPFNRGAGVGALFGHGDPDHDDVYSQFLVEAESPVSAMSPPNVLIAVPQHCTVSTTSNAMDSQAESTVDIHPHSPSIGGGQRVVEASLRSSMNKEGKLSQPRRPQLSVSSKINDPSGDRIYDCFPMDKFSSCQLPAGRSNPRYKQPLATGHCGSFHRMQSDASLSKHMQIGTVNGMNSGEWCVEGPARHRSRLERAACAASVTDASLGSTAHSRVHKRSSVVVRFSEVPMGDSGDVEASTQCHSLGAVSTQADVTLPAQSAHTVHVERHDDLSAIRRHVDALLVTPDAVKQDSSHSAGLQPLYPDVPLPRVTSVGRACVEDGDVVCAYEVYMPYDEGAVSERDHNNEDNCFIRSMTALRIGLAQAMSKVWRTFVAQRAKLMDRMPTTLSNTVYRSARQRQYLPFFNLETAIDCFNLSWEAYAVQDTVEEHPIETGIPITPQNIPKTVAHGFKQVFCGCCAQSEVRERTNEPNEDMDGPAPRQPVPVELDPISATSGTASVGVSMLPSTTSAATIGVDVAIRAATPSSRSTNLGCPVPRSPTNPSSMCVEKYGFVNLLIADVEDVQVVVAKMDVEAVEHRGKAPRIVIAFRGTANLANAKRDANIRRVVWHEMVEGMEEAAEAASRSGANGGFNYASWFHNLRKKAAWKPTVHAGFLAIWEKLRVPVMRKLLELLREDKEIVYHVFTTGHSLGGALASLSAYSINRVLIAERYPIPDVTVYTYGQPRMGNKTFTHAYEKAVPRTFRVMNESDRVATMALFGGYHAGIEVHIDREGNYIVNPTAIEKLFPPTKGRGLTLANHLLSYYGASLDRIAERTSCPARALLPYITASRTSTDCN